MKKETLVFVIICLFGLLFVFTIYEQEFMSAFSKKEIINEKPAPQLSDLFSDRPDGPHQKFSTKENCLRCHETGVETPGMGKAPKIPHEVRPNCISCHKLPAN